MCLPGLVVEQVFGTTSCGATGHCVPMRHVPMGRFVPCGMVLALGVGAQTSPSVGARTVAMPAKAAAIGTSIAIATCVPGCWHYACMTKRMTGGLARWPYRGMGPIGTIPAKKCESLSQLLYANYYSYVRVQWQRTNALKVRISIETLYHCFIDTSMIVVIECIERSAI